MASVISLYARHRAYLRAVAEGRAELAGRAEPDLYVDGLACCDQYTAHCLVRAHLIRPTHPDSPNNRVPAELTNTGRAALAA